MSNTLQVVLIIAGILTVIVAGTFGFTYFPTLSWIIWGIIIVGSALTVTGVLPSLYRKIKGTK